MKKLVLLCMIVFSFAATQNAMALVRAAVSVPLAVTVDSKTLKKDGFPLGASLQLQIPFSMIGVGFDWFAPKVISKDIEAMQQKSTVGSDGLVASGTLSIKSLNLFFAPPVPFVDVLVGGGVSFVSISKIGIDLSGLKNAELDPTVVGFTDTNYKPAIGWNAGVNIGIPIVALVHGVLGYRYVSAKVKPLHSVLLPEVNVKSSVITAGLSVGF